MSNKNVARRTSRKNLEHKLKLHNLCHWIGTVPLERLACIRNSERQGRVNRTMLSAPGSSFVPWFRTSSKLVEEQIAVAMQLVDHGRRVVGDGSDGGQSVSALEVRLDHLVVLAIAERHRLQTRTSQPGAEHRRWGFTCRKVITLYRFPNALVVSQFTTRVTTHIFFLCCINWCSCPQHDIRVPIHRASSPNPK